MPRLSRLVLLAVLLAGPIAGGQAVPPAAAQEPPAADGPHVAPTPRAECGPGSNPETGTQGRVPRDEVLSGRAEEGYTCNTEMVSRFGTTGGYKVERYVDAAGHECAYYDTTLLFPLSAINLKGGQVPGVAVLDMSDPARPVQTATLATPAMQSPHETLNLNAERGLLAAATSSPLFAPGTLDVYDVSGDCRNPVLKASFPLAGLGHESAWAPDGRTFYVAALHAPALTAFDMTDPMLPRPLGTYRFLSHGPSLSDDGNRLYMTTYSNATNNNATRGIVVYDVSDIQARRPNPQMKEVSRTTWALVSTPQTSDPITIDGHPYLLEMDEFAAGDRVGAARILDMADETKPKVISNIRLEVHQAEARKGDQANDPGADFSLQGYAGHYCSVPKRVDPGIVACTFILSGLRVFDIRDPYNPKEIAYFNGPIPKVSALGDPGAGYAMSSAAFVPERGEIWYSDGESGFYALRVTNGVWPFAAPAETPSSPGTPDARRSGRGGRGGRELPATGAAAPLVVGLGALAGGLGLRRLRRAKP